jgi:hypothetical protein
MTAQAAPTLQERKRKSDSRSIRFRLPPGGDIRPSIAAKRMGLTVGELEEALSRLIALGFPAPDPVTGNFPLEKIEAYREARYPQSTDRPVARGESNVKTLIAERVARLRRG